MPPTGSTKAFAKAVQTLLETNQVALGIEQIFFGDQTRIAKTPTVCVEMGDKDVSLVSAFRGAEADISCYVIAYLAVFGSPQDNAEEAGDLADAIETVLHEDAQLGGLVLHCYVSRVEPGYATKGNSIMRAVRLTFKGQTKYQLSSS